MAAQFGKRLRKGAATTAVAAVVMAALSASQAPGFTDDSHDKRASEASPHPDTPATGNSPYYTELPPLRTPDKPGSSSDLPGGSDDDAVTTHSGIPATVLAAYKKAEAGLAATKPGCHLPWQLLAAIGKVESGHARGGQVDAEGNTKGQILGPVLNGNGFAKITDTDGGAYDGDTTHDRAVGPMQFIPETWATSGQDGNGDGKKDPNNVFDAALAAGHYLCASGRDLSDSGYLHKAILSYNHSDAYLRTVLSWYEFYRKGTHEIPDGTGGLPGDRSDTPSVSPSPSATPSTPPSVRPIHPSGSTTPGRGGSGGGSGGGSTTSPPPTGGGSHKPDPGDSSTPGTPTPPPSTPAPADTVARFANVAGGALTATAGETFAKRPAVKAQTSLGKPVAKVRVKFTVVGDTGTRFDGGGASATVTTGSTGTATAPALRAGDKAGNFTVRATVVDGSSASLDFKAVVTARQADKLTRTSDEALTAVAGAAFADDVAVKATYKGTALAGTEATATMVKSADDSATAAAGPYFKDADGKPLRSLVGLKTNAKGVVTLPKIYADDTAGTFLLRVTTKGGATLTVKLTVTEAPDDGASGSPSADPSPSPKE
ncbi:lytic transglycosylase domain-containing protein [Streptomyces tsukubensis]|uniref:Lytic transglycosylase n=1 Tax=Streptomyces tsukubensis TaxID=83656 RepID=A0A1V4A3X7_9ACTN|nr:lytic transglycosylase domain-containing protein [Streptomyces tsukubensis]OON74668.1 lytic transglycosylase [Streptomyces tsukubensis]QFR93060.1 lytic transglycosylase [Streptomyces tsukubensis]